jgi:hypothetical protein
VADFIQNDGSWDLQRLERYFLAIDVADIIKIKPSRRNDPDFIAWQPDKWGMFSVRSAYNLALEERMIQQGIGATSARPDGDRPV